MLLLQNRAARNVSQWLTANLSFDLYRRLLARITCIALIDFTNISTKAQYHTHTHTREYTHINTHTQTHNVMRWTKCSNNPFPVCSPYRNAPAVTRLCKQRNSVICDKELRLDFTITAIRNPMNVNTLKM